VSLDDRLLTDHRRLRLLLVLGFSLALWGCATPPITTIPAEQDAEVATLRAKSPPGAINEDVTQDNIKQTICVGGWTATVRPSTVYTNGVKKKLMREQGLPEADISKYELDHFIPLALGGHPRKMENLWLQPLEGRWGAKTKDRLEKTLQLLVCRGRLMLSQAREAIRTDWIGAFKKYVGVAEPATSEQVE